MDHRVIGVLGASGGVGTSTLAVALGVRAARRFGVTACVDGDLWGGGLDVTACMEHLPGLRWGDLAQAAGELDGAALLRALPSQDGIAVLAAGDETGYSPVSAPGGEPRGEPTGATEVAARAVLALSHLCAVTVVDLGHHSGPASLAGLAETCTDLVLVAGTSARQLADAVAAARRVRGAAGRGTVALVLRTARRDPLEPEDVALRLDLPLAAVLPEDARVAVDADRGRCPGSRSTGRLAAVAERVVDWLEVADETGLGAIA